ncbi:MAG: penicillin-binding protein 1B [Gammaproteobacteria bacterium]
MWSFRLLILPFLVALVWLIWTDHKVRTQFEGRRWALPARVYARPLELYAGKAQALSDSRSELALLGYREVSRVTEPGQYRVVGERLQVATRGFVFWDGREPPRAVEIEFFGGRVRHLREGETKESLALVRLDPLEVARIYPIDAGRHNEDRLLVRRDEIPSMLVLALIAVEDKAYYRHPGVDPFAILRALIENLRAGEVRQGGSTLTQQLVKNFYLNPDRTLGRKINEALMALLLELRYNKEEILEAYVNEIYLGQDGPRAIHGFGLAAQFYFGRPLAELSTAQLALLAGMVRGASLYNPRRHPSRALKRRNDVLARMAEQGMLTRQDAELLGRAPLGVTARGSAVAVRFPAFTDMVRRQLRRIYREADLESEGLQVFTSLDPIVQGRAEAALSERLTALERGSRMQRGTLQGAVIAIHPENGEILALCGDRQHRYRGFNRALDARRPIGSLIKPAVYLAALSRPDRFNAVSPLEDRPFRWVDRRGVKWVPNNYTKETHGTVPLHEALARSYNLATVRLGMRVGTGEVRRTLARLGIADDVPDYPSLFLGAIDLSPLEVTQMYQTIASDGFHSPLHSIREVLTEDGQPLQRHGLIVRQTIAPAPAYLLKTLLTEVLVSGTAAHLSRAFRGALPLAGKTGTTDDLRDSWFVGFGGDMLATVWVGRDDNRSAGLSGAAGAMQVWSAMMRGRPPSSLDLYPPEGIEWHWVDDLSGARTEASCPGARRSPFITPYRPAGFRPCGEEAMSDLVP